MIMFMLFKNNYSKIKDIISESKLNNNYYYYVITFKAYCLLCSTFEHLSDLQ